jgi:MoaA/NifB/PqqE/SkfB family radical SAM enzyme
LISKLDAYSAPVMLTWQLTRDCNLACLHCCTDSAPGRALPHELTAVQAEGLVAQIVEAQVPYVMVVGGEPTIVPHFWQVMEGLGKGGVFLKLETNGQRPLDTERLKALPIRSVQVSIDGATQAVYGKMRPGGDLAKALEACASVARAGLPLEITFAPARLNLHEAEAVIDLAARVGAFRFNTGRLMRVGTAAKLWDRLEPSREDYEQFYSMLLRKERQHAGQMELCFRPFDLSEEATSRVGNPSGTLLILPDGRVKVSAALPYVCADLKTMTLAQAWRRYKTAWSHPKVAEALQSAAADEAALARANEWQDLELDLPAVVRPAGKEQQ